jgi:HSP20 family molecular chaperone IbpA
MPSRSRTLHRPPSSFGDFSDGGWGTQPDGPAPIRALGSVMGPVTDSPQSTETVSELVILETRANLFAAPAGWRPPVNAYRCQDRFMLFVDMAGVPPELVKVEVKPTRIVIHGNRPSPEPAGRRADLTQLLALEIDDGAFERVFDLPQEVDPQSATTEYRDGLLRIAVGLRT